VIFQECVNLPDWEITASTIYCEAIDDEVTLLVSKDGEITCTGQQRFQNPGKEDARYLNEKGNRVGRKLVCPGIDCTLVTEYKLKM
jgi:hypothetical protein